MKDRGGEYLKFIPPECKFDSPSYIINKVKELMLDEFAARIVSRQIALLNEYFKYSPNGMVSFITHLSKIEITYMHLLLLNQNTE